MTIPNVQLMSKSFFLINCQVLVLHFRFIRDGRNRRLEKWLPQAALREGGRQNLRYFDGAPKIVSCIYAIVVAAQRIIACNCFLRWRNSKLYTYTRSARVGMTTNKN